jgi:hypothetical protein
MRLDLYVGTVAILAQGTHWVAASQQAYCRYASCFLLSALPLILFGICAAAMSLTLTSSSSA